MEIQGVQESVFICNLDNSVSQKELTELFNFTTGTTGVPLINLYHFNAIGYNRIIGEIICTHEQSLILHSKLNNQKIKQCFIRLVPQNCMKALILSNLPEIFSVKDLHLILTNKSPGLKRIIVADNPENPIKTLHTVVAIYNSFAEAKQALIRLQGDEIMKKTITTFWKEPHFDILKELSMETRTLYIKNISVTTTAQGIRNTVSHFGIINRLVHYANKAYVEFSSVHEAKKAYQSLNDKRIDGTVWHIFPAKKFLEQRNREEPDKNLLYSKEFLSEEDQQPLLKIALEGKIPDVHINHQQKACMIMENIKSMQRRQVEMLQMQIENIKTMNGGGGYGGGGFNNNNNNNNFNQSNNFNQNNNFNNNNGFNNNNMNNNGFQGGNNNNNVQQGMNNFQNNGVNMPGSQENFNPNIQMNNNNTGMMKNNMMANNIANTMNNGQVGNNNNNNNVNPMNQNMNMNNNMNMNANNAANMNGNNNQMMNEDITKFQQMNQKLPLNNFV